MKHRLLFVDDEPRVLEGLRRSLRSMRQEWDMDFAGSGSMALEMLANGTFHAVVSDMRMPGMDGAELLERVRTSHPDAIRIILSGFCEQEAVLRTVGPAHQYLAKPVDAETLTRVLQRSLALRQRLQAPELRTIVGGVQNLPSPPDIYFQLLRELESERSSAKSIASIIERDVAMTAATLKMTNSAYFGLSRSITEVHRAVQYLGAETIKGIALSTGLYSTHSGGHAAAMISRLSSRSLGLGLMTRTICRAESFPPAECDQACCAAMLCHAGSLLLMVSWPDRFASAVRRVESQGIPIVDAEREEFGATHAELGGYLLGLWGFRDPVVEAVMYHHDPGSASNTALDLLAIISTCQTLAAVVPADGPVDDAKLEAALQRSYLERVGAWSKLPAWCKVVQDVKKWERRYGS